MNNFERLGRDLRESHIEREPEVSGPRPLGQVAMEAFYLTRFPLVDGPRMRWSHMDDYSKRAWEAAATAVLKVNRGEG